MDTNLLVTTIITILLALAGYFATYFNNLRLSQRSERLIRLNRQLGELYGPLFSLTHASNIAWKGFRSVYRPKGSFFGGGKGPTEKELKAWRLWMITVFMPINLKIYEIILSKSELLIETEMPECLLLFCAHTTAYQAVIKKWETGDYSEHLSVINYPSEIDEYAKNSYQTLKAEQAKLINSKLKSQK